jgi:hypothetical protein
MSEFVFNENIKRFPKILSFTQFIMSESIEPVETLYGTDYQNKNWIVHGTFRVTFYKSDKYSYAVIIDGFNIGFMVADNIVPIEDLSDIENLGELFSFEKKKRSEALRTFNNFFYIILEGIKKFNLNNVHFNTDDADLGSVYNKIVKNPFFNRQLNKVGLKYIKTVNNFHVFGKI